MIKSHQRLIRERRAAENSDADIFGQWWSEINCNIATAEIRRISHETAKSIVEKYEYLGTYANAPIASFGIFFDGNCAGCVVYGSPSPPIIAKSVIGEEYESKVIQLARGACIHWAHKHSASKLISHSLLEIQKLGYRIVIAFSDPTAGEIGTVYQASNWLYCGMTAIRPDYIDATGKRMVGHFKTEGLSRTERTRKRRYVYILGSKAERKFYKNKLLWPIQPYDKRIAGKVSSRDTVETIDRAGGSSPSPLQK